MFRHTQYSKDIHRRDLETLRNKRTPERKDCVGFFLSVLSFPSG